MNPLPSTLLSRVFPCLIFAAVPLAAFLAFLIQPVVGKKLLPIYGGTSGTWLGCMVFFQLTLLLGYSWAAWLVHKPIRTQVGATCLLALIAVASFHPPSDAIADEAGIARVVWRLSLSSLPAMVLLFSTSPLLHGWMRRRGGEVPYYLYAISNTGSLLGLLVYPFLVETRLRLSEQFFFWHGFLFVLAGTIAAAGYLLWRTPHASDAPAPTTERLAPATAVFWIWLSALGCLGMLGATYHLSAELGSSPIAWVGPFGLYLFSFMLTFSGRWQRWMTVSCIVWLAASLTGFMVTKGFTAATVDATRAWWLLSLTASASFLANALLHATRPAQSFEKFYLVLAAGGVLGGLVASTIAPHLLSRPIELVLSAVALLITGVIWFSERRHPGWIAVTSAIVAIPVLGLGLHQSLDEAPDGASVRHLRDLYGHLMVKTDDTSVVLSSDTTTHGTQLIENEAARRRPTLYYTENSAVGRVLQKLQETRPQLNVGVVGLGAGTLAAYAREGDVFDFWDIDPKAIRVAREHFTFVAESAGTINLIPRDGRKALAASETDYDVIVIDAFTGDGIPSHLLTREALGFYFNRLAKRRGLLVVHTSTRYSDFFPVVEATARTLGRSSLGIATEISSPGDEIDWDPARTDYVIVGLLEQIAAAESWFPAEEDDGRVSRELRTVNSPLINPRLIWSDERSAVIDTLRLGRFLFPRD